MPTPPYPLKFTPIFKEKPWGGNRLQAFLNKDTDKSKPIGESWEISDIKESATKLANGPLDGKTLHELTKLWGKDLLGNISSKAPFPLLVKFIDAEKNLSIQVHPNEVVAKKYGDTPKTEMWFVIAADPNAKLICGFNQKMNRELYLKHLNENSLEKILEWHPVQTGDVFFIPPGTIHSIGKGILLSEIQQSSDSTYRIYDWDYKDGNGNSRELHTEKAIEAIDFSHENTYKISYRDKLNEPTTLVKSQEFNTNLLSLDTSYTATYNHINSFVILVVCEGKGEISWKEKNHEPFSKGDTFLIPAGIKRLEINPDTSVKILETYIPT